MLDGRNPFFGLCAESVLSIGCIQTTEKRIIQVEFAVFQMCPVIDMQLE